MDAIDVRAAVLDVLGTVAPEAPEIEIRPEVDFRGQFDFNSLDFLKLAIALQQPPGGEIPEVTYPKLPGLDGCIAYLTPRLVAKAQA